MTKLCVTICLSNILSKAVKVSPIIYSSNICIYSVFEHSLEREMHSSYYTVVYQKVLPQKPDLPHLTTTYNKMA